MRHCIKNPYLRIVGVVFLLVFVLSFVQPCLKAEAAQASESLTLNEDDPAENKVFQVSNMVPGEKHTQTYRVEVIHEKGKNVGFRALVTDGSKKLADALQISVKLIEYDEVLYEGSVGEMTWVEFSLPEETQWILDVLVYEVTIFLDSSVGNEYQGQEATVSLEWQMEKTGGGAWIWIGVIGGILGLAGIGVGIFFIRKSCLAKQAARATGTTLLAIALIFSWSITTYALAWHQLSVTENTFSTGTLKVNLNDGKPVFDDPIRLEPGMMVQKSFTIANEGSLDVIFRLWFSEINGTLAKELNFEIKDGKKIIFEGVFEDLLKKPTYGTSTNLSAGDTKELTIMIWLPEEAGNSVINSQVTFLLNYDATQKDGNPGKEFE